MLAKAHKAAGARLCRALALALFALPAWATTWHVRPASGGEYGLEDGTSYANAYDGSPDITWGVGGVQPGDTLCIWDTWTGTADKDDGGTTRMLRAKATGTSGNIITIDGDCDGDGVYAVFNGNNEVADGFANVTAADGYAAYITLKNLTIKNFTSNGVTLYQNASTDYSQTAYITLDNLTIRDVGANGVQSRGRFITMTDLDIDGTVGDSIQHQGNSVHINRVRMRRMSNGGIAGDGIQIEVEADDYYIGNVDCEQIYDYKQCVIVNLLTSGTGANGILENFRAVCVPGGTAGACVFMTGDGAQIRRGFISGGSIGFRVAAASTSTNMTISSVVAINATTDNFQVPSSSVGANIAFVNNVGHGAGSYNFNLAMSSVTSHSVRNSISTNAGICGIRLTNASHGESYNDSFNSGTHNICQFANSRAAGTGTVTVSPQFIGGTNPTTPEGFRLSASSPLAGAGTDLGDEIADFFGDYMYNGKWDMGVFRRDSCYRRSRDGKLDMARTRSQVVSRCLGVPGRYPEGL